MDYIKPNWPAPHNIKAYTSTKHSWDGNQENISHLTSLLHLPNPPIWLAQIHSTDVVNAEPSSTRAIADASFTSEKNRICTALTADCLPILICNQPGTHVAAIHAGWRGLANGIIENTIQALSLPHDDLLIWLGPAIGPDHFEVGKDVYDTFVMKHAQSAEAFLPIAEDKWLANLYILALIRLHSLDISKIYGADYCTFSDKDHFYSYRRDKGKAGQMASLIWIEEK